MHGYTARKRKEMTRLRVRWLAYCFLVGLVVSVLILRLAPGSLWSLLAETSRGAKGQGAAKTLGLAELAPLLTMAGFLFATVVFVWRMRDKAATFAYERFRDSFQDELFDPIRCPAAENKSPKPMPWIAPSTELDSGDRLRIWGALHAWVRQGTDLDAPDAAPFSWALLVGRPGAGKSRTADEFARQLARREVLGDQRQHPQDWRSRWAAFRLRLGSGWRRARRRPSADDPWDTGRPAHRRNSRTQTELLQESKEFERRFVDWRPRAPTLIIFEDPRAEEAAQLIAWLAAKTVAGGEDGTEMPCKFPVRMLIVNQTMPADLKLVPVTGGVDLWGSGLGHFRGGPWVMAESSYFSWPEWQQAKQSRFPPEDARGWVAKAEFQTATRSGHPLLVESLLDWLQACPIGSTPSLKDVTPARLLQERAIRVLRALQAAELKHHEQWTLLAAASVVGGLKGLPPGRAIDGSALQRVFPDEDVQRAIPAIRPDLIGFAFADLVIETPSEAGLREATPEARAATARTMAQIAWLADPFAVLTALSRLADRAVQRESGPPSATRRLLIDALEAPPDNIPGVDKDAIARAFARHHMAHGRSLAQVRAHFANLTPDTALQIAVHDVLEELDKPATAARDALVVFSLAMERVLRAGHVDDSTMEVLLLTTERLSLLLTPRDDLPTLPGDIPPDGFKLLGMALALRLKSAAPVAAGESRIVEFVTSLWNNKVVRHTVLGSLCAELARGLERWTPDHLWWFATATDIAVSTDEARLEQFCDGLREAEPESSGLGWASALCHGWARAAYAHAALNRPVQVERCAGEIERLAKPFADRPHADRHILTCWAASAWAYASAAHSHGHLIQAEQAEACAVKIGQMAEPFVLMPEAERGKLAEWQAFAWSGAAAAYGTLKQPAAAERCTAQIARIATTFASTPGPWQLELAVLHANSWSSVAYAHAHSMEPRRAEQCATEVAQIIASFAALPAPQRRHLTELHVGCWMHAAYSYVEVNQVDQATRCVGEIARLVDSFSMLAEVERRELAKMHARVWANVAYAYGNAKRVLDAELCVDQVARIVEPFACLSPAERRELAERHAQACANAAYAHSQVHQSEQAELWARETARVVESFADLPDVQRLDIVRWQAQAWANVANAHSGLKQPGLAARCASEVARIIEPFAGLPASLRLQLIKRHAEALAYTTQANVASNQPEQAEHCAQEIALITEPFAHVPDLDQPVLAQWHAFALSIAAAGYDSSKQPLQAERCRSALCRVVAPWLGLPTPPDWVAGVMGNAGSD